MPTTTIDLLRHGQTDSTKHFGHPGELLTETGRDQMWRAIGDAMPWQSVFTSPYIRCAAIANELADRARLPVIELAELRALDWGAWTGKDKEDVMDVDGEALAHFDADPFMRRATGGESLTDMATRSVQGCRTILQQAAGRHVLVITHKWNVQAMVAYALQIPQRSMNSIVCHYGSLTRLEFTGSGSRYLVGLAFHTGGIPAGSR